MFWKILLWIQDKLRIAGACCLVGMMLLTCADVVGRIFRHPVLGSVELVTFMAALSMALALPYTHKAGGHIGVEILVRMLSERIRTIIDIGTGLVSLALFGIITWRMAVYAHTKQVAGEVSMNLELPEHLIVYALSFCLLIATLVILQEILLNIRKLSRK